MFDSSEETIQSLKVFENSSNDLVQKTIKELRLLEFLGKTGKAKKLQFLSEESYGAIE